MRLLNSCRLHIIVRTQIDILRPAFTFYKQKGANWVIKNISSDPATFAGKLLLFEASTGQGIVDVTVFSKPFTGISNYELLIEYKSGPGATVCDYINDDGKSLGNLVRELVSRDLTSLIRDNRTLANLQWRCEQPPADLQVLARDCLMSEIGRVELEKTTLNSLRILIPSAISISNFVTKLTSDNFFYQTFKIHP